MEAETPLEHNVSDGGNVSGMRCQNSCTFTHECMQTRAQARLQIRRNTHPVSFDQVRWLHSSSTSHSCSRASSWKQQTWEKHIQATAKMLEAKIKPKIIVHTFIFLKIPWKKALWKPRLLKWKQSRKKMNENESYQPLLPWLVIK